MTSIPIPIVAAMMLIMLAAMNHHQLSETSSGKLFMAVIYTYALSMLVIGLRWSLDAVSLMRFAAAFAIASTALLYLSFRSLGCQPALRIKRDWPHVIPLVIIVMIGFLSPQWTDLLLIITKVVYALLLLRLAKNSPVSLQLARLDWLSNTERALWIAAIMLLASAVVDVAIAIDFAFNNGRFAASIVGMVNLLGVLILGVVAVLAGSGSVDQETAPIEQSAQSPPESTLEDRALLDQLNTLLIEQQLYSDPNLNLQKLARKIGHPPRTISRAINQLTEQNVSQWVNSARINAACILLKNDKLSVTEAMMEAGFSTKSNFNREFRRVTGLSPSEWRRK